MQRNRALFALLTCDRALFALLSCDRSLSGRLASLGKTGCRQLLTG